jgi:hypothetical protein
MLHDGADSSYRHYNPNPKLVVNNKFEVVSGQGGRRHASLAKHGHARQRGGQFVRPDILSEPICAQAACIGTHIWEICPGKGGLNDSRRPMKESV